MALKNKQAQAGVRLKEGVTLQNYDENTFTPTFTGLTETPGTGSITKTGVYTRIGRMVFWEVKIAHTGDATTSASSSTTVDLPFTAAEKSASHNLNSTTNVGGPADVAGTTAAFTSDWPTSGNDRVIAGVFRI